ncbi:MAG: EamA family transporter [Phycisphaeraceae bacterium]|nr:EamA family transporter [Phycisphaeraceae bacterium]
MKAILFAVLAGVCWGVGELFSKSVLSTGKVGPITVAAVRAAVALPALWIAYYWAVHIAKIEPTGWHRAGTGTMLKLILGTGLIAGSLALIFFYAALNFGEISVVKPISFALAPALAFALAVPLFGESVTPKKLIGVALIVVGVVLLSSKSVKVASPAPATEESPVGAAPR